MLTTGDDGYLYIDGKRLNFTEAEMACRCGCGMLPSEYFMADLQAFRNACGFSFPVTSGARCPAHNAKQGGAPGSWHLKGEAGDTKCTDSARRYTIVTLAPQYGFHGIGIAAGFVHLDRRKWTEGRIWTYS